MFRGINTINLDAKGRMALPARCRELLASFASAQLVVTIDTNHRCLLLYPLAEWEQIERQIEKAVYNVLSNGVGTPDIGGTATTKEVSDAIVGELRT